MVGSSPLNKGTGQDSLEDVGLGVGRSWESPRFITYISGGEGLSPPNTPLSGHKGGQRRIQKLIRT